MKVTMKMYEKMAMDYCAKFKKDWATYCAVSDAYLNGYKDAMDNVLLDCDQDDFGNEPHWFIYDPGQEPVEVEFKDGSHMIGARSTDEVQD